MSDELFPVESVQMDSPRLAWLKRHAILTWYDDGKRDGFSVCPAQWFAGFQVWWPNETGMAFFGAECSQYGDSRIGEGDSEDEALCALLTCFHARQNGIKHWSVETPRAETTL